MNLRRHLLPISMLLVAVLAGCNPFTPGRPPKPIIKGIGTIQVFAGSDEAGFEDGRGKAARFDDPRDVTVDAEGNVYVSDARNYVVRKISPEGEVSTLAGNRESGLVDGKGDQAGFVALGPLVVTQDGIVFVKDAETIREIQPDGTTSSLAGREMIGAQQSLIDGKGTAATFDRILDLALAPDGDLVVVDNLLKSGTDFIRRVTRDGEVTTLWGRRIPEGMSGEEAQFDDVESIAVESDGTIVLAQRDGYMKGGFDFLSVDGMVTRKFESKEEFRSSPSARDGIAIDGKGNYFFNDGGTFYRVDAGGEYTMLIGPDNVGYADAGSIYGMAVAPDGSIYFVALSDNRIYKISL